MKKLPFRPNTNIMCKVFLDARSNLIKWQNTWIGYITSEMVRVQANFLQSTMYRTISVGQWNFQVVGKWILLVGGLRSPGFQKDSMVFWDFFFDNWVLSGTGGGYSHSSLSSTYLHLQLYSWKERGFCLWHE